MLDILASHRLTSNRYADWSIWYHLAQQGIWSVRSISLLIICNGMSPDLGKTIRYIMFKVVIILMHFSDAGHESASNTKLPYFRADGCRSYNNQLCFLLCSSSEKHCSTIGRQVSTWCTGVQYPWPTVQLDVDRYVHRDSLLEDGTLSIYCA